MLADRWSATDRALAPTDELIAHLSVPFYEGDVSMLIASAEHTYRAYRNAVSWMPRTHRARAIQLLRTYRELLRLLTGAPRDRQGALLRRDEMTGGLVPWTPAAPRTLAEIRPFTLDNVIDWALEALLPEEAMPPAPPVPPRAGGRRGAAKKKAPPLSDRPRIVYMDSLVPADPRLRSDGDLGLAPRPVPAPPPPPLLSVNLIKTPGMAFDTPDGLVQIYAAILRVLTRQALDEAQAEKIVRSLGDLPTVTGRSIKSLAVGDMFSMELKPKLFEALAKTTAFKGFDFSKFKQDMTRPVKGIGVEMFPDFSTGERLMYVTRQWSAANRVGGSQFQRGHIYFGGLAFVGWGKPWATGEPDDNRPDGQTTWFAPDGRIYYFVYRENLEAFKKGVLDASGGVTLAWATLAIGALAVTGPELVALYVDAGTTAYTAGARAVAASGEFVGLARATPYLALVRLCTYSGVIFETGTSLVNLGEKIADQGLLGMLRSMDPREVGFEAAVSNLLSNLLDVLKPLHAYDQVRVPVGAPSAPEPEDPPPASPAAPARSMAAPETPLPVLGDRGTLSRSIGPDPDPEPATPAMPRRVLGSEDRGLPATAPANDNRGSVPAPANESRVSPATAPADDRLRSLTRSAANDNGGPSSLERVAGTGVPPLADAEDSPGPRAAASVAEAVAADAEEVVELERRLEQQQGEELEQQAVASAGGRPKRSGAPAATRGTSGSSKAIGSRGASVAGGGGGSSAGSGPTRLDARLCDEMGVPKAQRAFIEYVARIWRQRNFALRHIQSARERGVQAHAETQRDVTMRYLGSVAEEPTGISGPGLKRSDLMYSSRTGPVVELKPRVVKFENGELFTSHMAVAAGVPTIQIQAYEAIAHGHERLVVVITASGYVYTPNPDTKEGWILLGGP
jgi:hypothetical protein